MKETITLKDIREARKLQHVLKKFGLKVNYSKDKNGVPFRCDVIISDEHKPAVELPEEIGEVDHGMPDRVYVLFKQNPSKHDKFEAENKIPRCHGFVEYVKRSVVVDLLKGKRGIKRASKSHFSWR